MTRATATVGAGLPAISPGETARPVRSAVPSPSSLGLSCMGTSLFGSVQYREIARALGVQHRKPGLYFHERFSFCRTARVDEIIDSVLRNVSSRRDLASPISRTPRKNPSERRVLCL